MDAFYASVEQLRRPELRGKPVVVGHDGSRGVVAAASYEARRFGIHSAMPSATARRLCRQAIFIPPDFVAYRDASSQVFSVLRRYTPLIEPLALDEAYLDLSGDRDARAAAEATGGRLKREIREATGGLTASVGIGTCKVVAKVGSDLRKPDGLVVVPPGTEAAFLAPLPMRVLPGLGPAAEKRLAGLGLRTVEDLAALPEEVLRARLGNSAAGFRALALGQDPRPVSIPGTPRSISREITFEKDIEDAAALRREVRVLAQDVARSLRSQSLWARTIRMKVRYAGFETHTLQATLPGGTDSDREFLEMADRLLAQATASQRPVRLIGIGAAGLSEAAQPDLLDGAGARDRALDQAMDQLRDRFGASVVRRGPAVGGRQLDFRREDLDAVRDGIEEG
ncbi:MAG: polymerase [Chloroflexota bacterium]|jgi:DNA polymerase-4|nr:polymerase [Chloroflexota bacterium]